MRGGKEQRACQCQCERGAISQHFERSVEGIGTNSKDGYANVSKEYFHIARHHHGQLRTDFLESRNWANGSPIADETDANGLLFAEGRKFQKHNGKLKIEGNKHNQSRFNTQAAYLITTRCH